jgi:hypothetical protein
MRSQRIRPSWSRLICWGQKAWLGWPQASARRAAICYVAGECLRDVDLRDAATRVGEPGDDRGEYGGARATLHERRERGRRMAGDQEPAAPPRGRGPRDESRGQSHLLPAVDADDRAGGRGENGPHDAELIAAGADAERAEAPSVVRQFRRQVHEQVRLAAAVRSDDGAAPFMISEAGEEAVQVDRAAVSVERRDGARLRVPRGERIGGRPWWAAAHGFAACGMRAGGTQPTSNTCSDTKSLPP